MKNIIVNILIVFICKALYYPFLLVVALPQFDNVGASSPSYSSDDSAINSNSEPILFRTPIRRFLPPNNEAPPRVRRRLNTGVSRSPEYTFSSIPSPSRPGVNFRRYRATSSENNHISIFREANSAGTYLSLDDESDMSSNEESFLNCSTDTIDTMKLLIRSEIDLNPVTSPILNAVRNFMYCIQRDNLSSNDTVIFEEAIKEITSIFNIESSVVKYFINSNLLRESTGDSGSPLFSQISDKIEMNYPLSRKVLVDLENDISIFLVPKAVIAVPVLDFKNQNKYLSIYDFKSLKTKNPYGIVNFFSFSKEITVDNDLYFFDDAFTIKEFNDKTDFASTINIIYKLATVVVDIWNKGLRLNDSDFNDCIIISRYINNFGKVYNVHVNGNRNCIEPSMLYGLSEPSSITSLKTFTIIDSILNNANIKESDNKYFEKLSKVYNVSNVKDLKELVEYSKILAEHLDFTSFITLFHPIWKHLKCITKDENCNLDMSTGYIEPSMGTMTSLSALFDNNIPISSVSKCLNLNIVNDLMNSNYISRGEEFIHAGTLQKLHTFEAQIDKSDRQWLSSFLYSWTILKENGLATANGLVGYQGSRLTLGILTGNFIKKADNFELKSTNSFLSFKNYLNNLHLLSLKGVYYITRDLDEYTFIDNDGNFNFIFNPSLSVFHYVSFKGNVISAETIKDREQLVASLYLLNYLKLRGILKGFDSLIMRDIILSSRIYFKETFSYKYLQHIIQNQEELEFISFMYFDRLRQINPIDKLFHHRWWDVVLSGNDLNLNNEIEKYEIFSKSSVLFQNPNGPSISKNINQMSIDLLNLDYTVETFNRLMTMHNHNAITINSIKFVTKENGANTLVVELINEDISEPLSFQTIVKVSNIIDLYRKYGFDVFISHEFHNYSKLVKTVVLRDFDFNSSENCVYPFCSDNIKVESILSLMRVGSKRVPPVEVSSLANKETIKFVLSSSSIAPTDENILFKCPIENLPKFEFANLLNKKIDLVKLGSYLTGKAEEDNLDERTSSLYKNAKKDIDSYFSFFKPNCFAKFSNIGRGEFDMDGCAVCMQTFEDSSIVSKFPCDHTLCIDCATNWYTKNKNSCVLCRKCIPSSFTLVKESLEEDENSASSANSVNSADIMN